ncbi:hypothetical protein [Thiolapillus sp.]|uniref:hypothetical protein n=1 Tax=Thiolapillus sp. TaxID=2017437 RepID=UPI003AF897CA
MALHYAPAEWLEELGNAYLKNVNLSVQVRVKGGKSTGEIAVTGDNMRCLHPLLEKWMVESDKSCQ